MKNDIEAGLGQCAAQMVASRIFNEQKGRPLPRIFGCVTTGETWQFLRLEGPILGIERTRLYIDNVGLEYSDWQAVLSQAGVFP